METNFEGKSMKIKTITCHDVYNVGASLQAYALMAYLCDLGHDIEIIDYKPKYLSAHYKICAVNNERYKRNIILRLVYILAKLPSRLMLLKRKRVFDRFKVDYLRITKKRYVSNEEMKNDLPEADIYFAGSDQIWNTVFSNGKDPAFYLDFVPDAKIKASYAASFATETISNELKEIVSKRLKRLDAISVRESSGLDILKDCGIENGVQVLDPVFLLDKVYWERMCVDIPSKDEYLLVYDFDNNDIIRELAKKTADNHKLKIFSVFKSDYADKEIRNIGPLEFISYIKNAKFIISNSLHATAFSIIFEKEFFVINREESINTRMRDLLLLLSIRDRIISNRAIVERILPINYKTVNSILKELVGESKKYIDRVLERTVNN